MAVDRETLHQMQNEIQRCPCPALLVDAQGMIRFRNRRVAKYVARQRTLQPLLAEDRGPDAALVLRPVSDTTMLVWIAPLRDGFRKVLFVRDLTEREIFLFHSMMARIAKATEAGKAASDSDAGLLAGFIQASPIARSAEPIELFALLKSLPARPFSAELTWELPDFGKRELWTVPETDLLCTGVAQSVRLLCGPATMKIAVRPLRGHVQLKFSFRDRDGIADEMMRLFFTDSSPDLSRAEAFLPLLSVFRCCQRYEYALSFDRENGVSDLRITLPASDSIPTLYFQGYGRKRRPPMRRL
ncbi:MAG: hypothetical protein J5940_00205 [Clostridia bacterium]|nr:hypothetical protein [Clostridia bacterium]